MNVTEAEAKTKWCPFARLSEMGGTYNRIGPAADLYCIGSACMAWRKGKGAGQYRDGTIYETDREPDYTTRGGGWVTRGGCGLADAP